MIDENNCRGRNRLGNKQSEIIVVIPYYHTDLSKEETISLKQAQKVLKDYDFCFISPLRLKHVSRKGKYWVEYFEDSFFESVSTYNKLMLTSEFYERFTEYRYMLIYQLDAFVFCDKLDYFCNLNYDYIGAPWIYLGRGMVGGINQKAYVGNGGLSLRKICSCIKLLHDRKKELRDFAYNEDFFFSIAKGDFHVAPLSIALEFSIETHVRKCFEISGRRLPFGCHAWEKYDFLFWKPYIEKQGYDLSYLKIKTGSEDDILDKKIENYKYRLLDSMQLYSIDMQNLLREKDLEQKRFTIWGGGKYGKQIVELFLQSGIEVDYVIDENEMLEDKTIYNVPVVNFQTYKSLSLDNVIVIAVKRYMDDIQKELEENNFVRKKDFISMLEIADMYYIDVLCRMCKV